MSDSQPFYSPCKGGLVLNQNKFDLLRMPGVAIRLRNFEVTINGGYRKINGYKLYGLEDATRPNGDNEILGVYPYALGTVVVSGTGVWYTEDGEVWLQVNKNTTHAGMTEPDLIAAAAVPRVGQTQAMFAISNGEIDHATNTYGVLYIATGENAVAHFHIDGVGALRKFVFTELADPDAGKYIANYEKHLIVVDTVNKPYSVLYSGADDFDNFLAASAGEITVPSPITGIKTFRDTLYIFCEDSIYKLVDINDVANIRIIPVTSQLGCVAGHSIQELGGDLIFLAADGFRTVASTERIADVELGSVSKNIQPLLMPIIMQKDVYTFHSMVRRNKSQYRFFYTNSLGVCHGFAGTLVASETGVNMEWSELRNMNLTACCSQYNENEIEVSYQGDIHGYVYTHDDGNSFNGSNIKCEYTTPDFDAGDLGILKTLHYMNIAVTNDGDFNLMVEPRFDFYSNRVTQPGMVHINHVGEGARWDISNYGSHYYSSGINPLLRIPLQGSGHSMSFSFACDDVLPQFTINGFHLEMFPSGRR
jgi:hypothetical protein